MSRVLFWNPAETPAELHPLLRNLAEEVPLRECGGAGNLRFEPLPQARRLRVTIRDGVAVVGGGARCGWGRGVAYALAGVEVEENSDFDTFSILLDCTRGAVMTVAHLRRWLRRLALFGCNMVMLYVKDAYLLEGEPYFGCMRGAYTREELREIDACARELGIEMVASIQTLGHLEPLMRWSAYAPIHDTGGVILAEEPASLRLLEKMISFWSEVFPSRRIHLGMDEAHGLGRGRYLSLHGYVDPFRIYLGHLNALTAICRERGLKPIIWPDMFFRLANPEGRYDASKPIPEAVRRAIPEGIEFSHWDYTSTRQESYETMLQATAALNGKTPFMASGIWTWKRFWTDFDTTRAAVEPCIAACRKCGVREINFTLWGDDGAYCEFDSMFATLAWCADCVQNPAGSEARAAKLFEAVFESSYELQKFPGRLAVELPGRPDSSWNRITPAAVLWDDPLMAINYHEMNRIDPELPERLCRRCREIMEYLAGHRGESAPGRLDYAWCVADAAFRRIQLNRAVRNAWRARDRVRLEMVLAEDIPAAIAAMERLAAAFRRQWFRSFKSYGLEIDQNRFAASQERLRELARRLREFLDGCCSMIDELEQNPEFSGEILNCYSQLATGSWFL